MNYQILQGDCIQVMKTLPANSVQTCVTSPPYYGLRSYLPEGDNDKPLEIGTEKTPEEYVAKLVDVFREVRRLLKDDGVLWLNLGDSYNGSGGSGGDYSPGGRKEGQPRFPGRRVDGLKAKDLIGIPWRVALALQADGWWLRCDVIWNKPSVMPDAATDRPTRSHEYIFLLSKNARYFYDADAIAEPVSESTDWTYPQPNKAARSAQTRNGTGASSLRMKPADGKRNRRSVWTIPASRYDGAHFATYPFDLAELCILAGSKPGDTVLDPFFGSGTTAAVALKHGRKFIGCDLDGRNLDLAHERIGKAQPLLLQAL